MIDEKKIRLMTRMASYEKNEGKKDLKISSYYRKDYISLHVVYTIIWITIGYVFLVALAGICLFDKLLGAFSLGMLFGLCLLAFIGYVAMIVLYSLATHMIYSKKYQSARTRVKKYNHDLSRLLKMYEKERK